MKLAQRRLLVFAAMICLFAPGGIACAQSAFTYQGVITQAGSPMAGTVHLRFQLWNALSGGTQVGADVNETAAVLDDGRFTVQLDFGAIAFDGSPRWLQVSVVTNGGSTVTTLSPRMAVTAVPHAMIATKATTVADGGLPATYASPIALTNAGNMLAGTFAGNTEFESYVGINAEPNVDHGRLTVRNGLGATAIRVLGTGPFGSDGKIQFQNDLDVSLHNSSDGTLTINAFNVVLSGGATIVTSPFFTQSSASFTNGMTVNGASILQGVTTMNAALNASGNVNVTGSVAAGTSKMFVDIAGGNGVHVETDDPGNGARAILGWARAASGDTRGIYARSDSPTGTGLYGWSTATTGSGVGVWGIANSGGFGYCGVEGELAAAIGTGYALHGTQGPSSAAYALFALGRSAASGTKSFRIDHPSDPENKYLFHYCSESPEPLNVYSGSVRLNAMGEAVVELPSYFSAINIEPRIQLTAAGAAMPNLFAAEEVINNTFQISGGKPNGKVYWEVKAVRNDRWVQAYGAPTEIEKPDGERGLYQHPELYGKPAHMGANYVRQQRALADTVVNSEATGDAARRPTPGNE